MICRFFLLLLAIGIASAIAIECGENEEMTCASCPPGRMCPMYCRQICVCVKGYVRNIDGTCIPRVLPFTCAKKNEWLNRCPGPCTPLKYTECFEFLRRYVFPCDPTPRDGPCRPRCDCNEGYLRNDMGECVKEEGCCTQPNTELKYDSISCRKTCANLDTWGKYTCRRVTDDVACVCKEGYVQSLGGRERCVLPKDCPKDCGKNETFDYCLPCEPGKPCPKICRTGCVCKEAFRRNKKGVCVPVVDNCNKDCEVFGIKNCDATCEDPNLECSLRNRLGCFCRKGYLRDANNKCIPVEDCPNKCSSDLNEVFDRGGMDGTCDDPELRYQSVNKAQYACRCPEGYLRNHLNVCVLPEECIICSDNEVYRNGEDDATCKEPLIRSPGGDDYNCRCKPGYVRAERNKFNPCIKIEECPNDCNTRPNEEFKRGSCEPSCGDPNPDPDVCKKGTTYSCFCKEGYLRNSQLECVLPNDCKRKQPTPPPVPMPKCKKDEILNKCPRYCSQEDDCDTEFKGGRRMCIPEGAFKYKCKPRCECKKGLLRKDGKCVKPIKCCTDPNEVVAKCPQPCERSCSALEPVEGCMKERCYENTCICAEGYVRNDVGACVLESECTGPCGRSLSSCSCEQHDEE